MYSSPSGPVAVTCVMYWPDLAQWKWDVSDGRMITAPGGVRLQLLSVKLITQADVEDA